jgi:hypothetical protein
MTPTTRKILTRHNCASPREFAYYAAQYPMRHLKQMLNRSERTISDWLNGNKVIPPWAIAVLRLQQLEHELRLDQMGHKRVHDELEVIDPRQLAAANDSRYEEPAATQPHASTDRPHPAPAARTPATGPDLPGRLCGELAPRGSVPARRTKRHRLWTVNYRSTWEPGSSTMPALRSSIHADEARRKCYASPPRATRRGPPLRTDTCKSAHAPHMQRHD